MEPFHQQPFDSSAGFDSENSEKQHTAEFPNWELTTESTSGVPSSDPQPFPNESGDNPGYCDFFDEALGYIDEILMDDDLGDKAHSLLESTDYQEKERSFYELLGQKYPSPQKDDNLEARRNNNDSSTTNDYGDGQAVRNFEAGGVTGGDSFPSTGDDTMVKTRRKKNHKAEGSGLEEGRCHKQPVISLESNLPIEYFDHDSIFTVTQHEGQNPPGKGKKKKRVVDFETLLMSCAESISSGDPRSATKQLKNIRTLATPYGNGSQRLAHYFANGLEARLSGPGPSTGPSYSISDYLKAYRSSLTSSAFMKLTDLAMNSTIAIRSGRAARVHVIDFGILYGFQWPGLIQCLAGRAGGPPKLRITGVHVGPAEVVEEAGRWLTRYAEKHGVPFEYNGVAKKWETVGPEDLKIEDGEFLAVNCKIQAMCLPDETGGGEEEESPRARFLEMVRKMNPDVFVHGVANAALAGTSFMARFREILSHYSALFDMLETTLPREQVDRATMEQMLGKEATHVIANEGPDRVMRPETYKSWEVRHVRAGLGPVPFDGDLIDRLGHKVRSSCHREMLVGKDKGWLLLSWKGRVLLAVSCWRPV